MKLFADADERAQALMISAGMALHALIGAGIKADLASSDPDFKRLAHRSLVTDAFAIADEFLRQAEAHP